MTEDQERIAALEERVEVLFAMLYCQNRGLNTLFECFGIDPHAACADLESRAAASG